jgi:hypothetical protein
VLRPSTTVTADQKFTDQQMALILKRAAELQATGDEPAHSLESIQQIAEQVGIDPKFVADVAATLDQPRGGSSLLGAPSGFRLTRRVEGPQAIDRASVLSTIRDHLPYGAGEMRAVGDGIEWHAGPADNKTVVAVAPSSDRTTIRVDVRQHGVKALAYIGGVSVGVLTGGISIALWHAPGAAVAAAAIGASFAGTRALWNRHVDGRRQLFRRLLDAPSEELREPRSPKGS